MSVRILVGDALERLKALPDASVHAIVTDPPAGIAFMGKSWDEDKGGRDEWIKWLASVMREAFRVAKPGAHAVVWALPRTSHWTAMALEDAGFEIRDSLHHVFGSGFPKALDVSKAIDAVDGVAMTREAVLRFTDWLRSTGVTAKQINEATSTFMASHYLSAKEQPAVPTPEHWVSSAAQGLDKIDRRVIRDTYGYSMDAKKWEGWKTAMKPAHEVWWLARKPLDGSVAGNVLAHGCGALNVDGCRVEVEEGFEAYKGDGVSSSTQGWDRPWKHHPEARAARAARAAESAQKTIDLGRYPSNFLLSHSFDCVEGGACAEDCPVAEMDRQSGEASVNPAGVFAVGQPAGWSGGSNNVGRAGEATRDVFGYGDAGGASRFFPVFRYEAKPSRGEREAGLREAGLREETVGSMAGGGEEADDPVSERFTKTARNIHPTVKSVALMSWLCKLVTPPGGTVLDCFGGSGSTAVAAQRCGFDAILVEREAEYVAIAEARIRGDQPLFSKVSIE